MMGRRGYLEDFCTSYYSGSHDMIDQYVIIIAYKEKLFISVKRNNFFFLLYFCNRLYSH